MTLGEAMIFLKYNTESTSEKEKQITWTLKLKAFVFQKIPSRE